MRAVGFAVLALLGGCGESDETPESSGATEACPNGGVSKGPWALRVDETSAVVRWETCRPNTKSGLEATPEQGGESLRFESTASSFELLNTYMAPFNLDAPPDEAGTYWIHEAQLSDLAPGTCYEYELSADPVGGRVCTARPAGDRFKFLATADTNPGLGRVTEALLTHAEPHDYDFSVHGGDIQYYDSGFETWGLWFTRMSKLLSQGAFLPSIGNHELEKDDEYDAYYVRFFGGSGFDGTDAYYRFHSGGVWFFTLNTEENVGAGSPQLAWLTNQLQDASSRADYRFGVVYFHRPFLTCGDKSQDSAARTVYEPLFAQHGVRLVIQGHMHGYERFEVPVPNGSDTITYLTVGGGGGALGDVDENIDRPTCALRVVSGAYKHMAVIEVTETGLSGTVFDEDGKVTDQFDKPI